MWVEDLTISAFGQSAPGTKMKYRRVQAPLRSFHGWACILIEAWEVSKVWGEVHDPRNGDVVNNIQAKPITFAELPYGDADSEPGITMLVGPDCYWRVTRGNVERVNTTVTAVETNCERAIHGSLKGGIAALWFIMLSWEALFDVTTYRGHPRNTGERTVMPLIIFYWLSDAWNNYAIFLRLEMASPRPTCCQKL